MPSLSRSSGLLAALTLALCSCAGESTDSTPGDTDSIPGDDGPVAEAQEAWSLDGHIWLTHRAAQLANATSPPLALPWSSSQTCGSTQLAQGDCDTDSTGGKLLNDYYGADIFNGVQFQHLHFNLDYVSRSDIERIGTPREACLDARASILEATHQARARKLAGDPQQAFYFLGHALHTIQDSFPRAHSDRLPPDYRALNNVSVWGLDFFPPALEAHDSFPGGDQVWTGCSGSDGCLKPNAFAALQACKGYLLLASEILSDPSVDIDATLNPFFDQATDATDGFFKCGTLSDVPVAFITPRWSGTWSTGWTSLKPFTRGSTTYLLGYKSGTGKVAFLHVLPTAQGVETSWSSTWTTGWSSFVTYTQGAFVNTLEYKSSNGQVAIDRIRDDLQGVTPCFQDTWTTGWSSFTTFKSGSIPYLFSYKIGTGQAAIDRLTDTGTQPVWSGYLPAGFTHVTGFAGEAPFILAYAAGSGNVRTYALASTGVAPSQLWQSTWTPDWSLFLPVTLDSGSHFLEYKDATNTVALDKTNSGGVGTTEARRGTWTSGWDLGAAFPLGGNQHYLVYKQGSGTVAIDRAD